MSKTSGQKDPSMDEILGSIRRIISEDNAQSGQTADAAVSAKAEPEDDILELTDALETEAEPESRREPILKPVEVAPQLDDESGTPGERREPVLGIHSPPAAATENEAAAIAEPPPVKPAVEGEQAHVEPAVEGEQAHVEPAAEAEQALAEPAAGVELTPSATAPQAERPPESAPLLLRKESAMAASDEPPAMPAEQPDATGDDIVSETASTATTAALGELSRVVEEKVGRLRLGEGDATVSDIVRELLRPMLKDWIDQNLPMIVERVVRREIQKLVDRAPDDD